MYQDKTKSNSSNLSKLAGEYLAFRIGREEYGFEILSVQEIRSYERPTKMVNAPDYVKGVIDLRQKIIPIVDLRMKMGYTQAEITTTTVVIVVNVNGSVIGMVADSVADVVDIAVDELHESPANSVDENGVVKAIASFRREGSQGAEGEPGRERMVSLLNLPRLAGSLAKQASSSNESQEIATF